LFVWPTFLSFQAVVTGLEFEYQHFAQDGALMRYTAKLTLEAERHSIASATEERL
jgi:hypothetical protein